METASKEQEIKRRITLGWQAFGRASAIAVDKYLKCTFFHKSRKYARFPYGR